jgi:hypothetical protein
MASVEETECHQLHEKLETVTIRSSVLRYRLRTFPEQFKAELKEAMAAAHQLNAAQIKELKVWTVSGLSNIGIVYTYIVLIFRGFFRSCGKLLWGGST